MFLVPFINEFPEQVKIAHGYPFSVIDHRHVGSAFAGKIIKSAKQGVDLTVYVALQVHASLKADPAARAPRIIFLTFFRSVLDVVRYRHILVSAKGIETVIARANGGES